MNYTSAIFSSVILNAVCATAYGQTVAESEVLEEYANYRAQVAELEEKFGRFDQQLLEPLSRLVDAAINLDQFDEAHSIIDRSIQVYRLNEGLFTENQLPLLQMMAANNIRRGDWDKVNDTLEHLLWLYTNKHRGFDSDLIYELKQIANLHFEAIAGDELEMQASHFRKAADISLTAINVGETLWEPNDVRLPELYYDLVKQFYLQSIALENGGRIAYELREVMPGSGWVRPRLTVQNQLYRAGIRLFNSIREVFEAADPPNPEAVAMADLYKADWELVFGNKSTESSYAQAFEGLLTSGVSIETLHRFFDQPKLLPINNFYLTVDQALLENQQESSVVNLSLVNDNTNSFQFNEWSTAFSNVQYPLNTAPLFFDNSGSLNIATFSFELAALDKVSRWVNGRYLTNISVPLEFEIIAQSPDSPERPGKLTSRIHKLHFRPRLNQGIPQPSTGTMRYQYFTE